MLMEEPVLIPNGTDTMVGVLYRPEGRSARGLVVCNPLFEERKSAQRVMVDAARAFAAAGCAVVRFDFRGCGDSSGDFAAFTCADWRADIGVAARFLAEKTGVSNLGLLGLRLGASLALGAAAEIALTRFLVLWEPILSGRRYFDQELRRKLVKEMVTFGQNRTTRASLMQDLDAGKPIDLDGYAVTPQLFAGLAAIDLTQSAPRGSWKTLLVQIAPAETASRDLSRLRDTLVAGGVEADLIAAKEDPFWNLVGLVECPTLIAQTRQWIM